jgi:hypothetical protein
MRAISVSGVKGVNQHSGKKSWRARIRGPEGPIHFGTYATIADAAKAYQEAAAKLHAEFYTERGNDE